MDIEQAVMRRVTRRLVPLLLVCYFAAYLDRVNVSFASLQMNRDLGFSAATYGFGAGLFFVSYCLCEIPSNLLMHKLGARRWIARIMATWGLCAGATAFVQGPMGFYIARLLLGIAEAGFQPGIILFVTLWFPNAYRARIVSWLLAAVPISGTIGSPISGLLLSLHGFGLAGWQWLFIVEAVPSIVLSAVVLTRLTDRPAQANWLDRDQRDWLSQRIGSEQQAIATRRPYSVAQALTSPITFGLAAVYFTDVALNNANAFFLPQIIKSFGLGNTQTGFVAAIPNLFGLLGILWWGRHSDRSRERIWHAVGALVLGGAGLIVAAASHASILSVVALSVAVAGTYAFTPPFWAIASSTMSGIAAAAAIGIVSAIGNFGGFVAPSIMGYLRDLTGSFASGQIAIACMAFAGALLLLLIARWRKVSGVGGEAII